MEVFQAAIEEADRGGAYVVVPPAVSVSLGGKLRTPVRATFDGVEHAGSVVSMGGGKILGIRKEIRAEIGKRPGDTVTVTLEVDRSERAVAVPGDLAEALRAGGVEVAFAALSYSHRREHVNWVEEANKPGARSRRIAQTVGRLRG